MSEKKGLRLKDNPRDQFDRFLYEGDAVQVYFNSNLNAGFAGIVARRNTEGVQLRVHSAIGDVAVMDDLEPCFNWDTFIPWSSIGYVRHVKQRLVGCKCDKAVKRS